MFSTARLERRRAVGEPDPVRVEERVDPVAAHDERVLVTELELRALDPRSERIAGRVAAGQRPHRPSAVEQLFGDRAGP